MEGESSGPSLSPEAFLFLSFQKSTVAYGMYVCGQTKAPDKQSSAVKENARVPRQAMQRKDSTGARGGNCLHGTTRKQKIAPGQQVGGDLEAHGIVADETLSVP